MRGSISFPQLWITDFVKRWKRKLSQWNEEQPKGISKVRVTWTFTSLLFPVAFLYQKWFVSGPDFQLFSFFLIKKYYYCVYMMCVHNVCEDMGHSAHGRTRTMLESVLSFHLYTGSRDQTQVARRLGKSHLYSLSQASTAFFKVHI